MRSAHRLSTVVFGLIAIGLGLAIVGRTLAAGGGIGILLGVLFVAVGVGRLILLRRR
ncbi:MAG TPA: hypothetical protein VKR23_10065 [Gaiellaceae bacterium]|nr:hypothetical protein [Gaiellaceae bacterium]